MPPPPLCEDALSDSESVGCEPTAAPQHGRCMDAMDIMQCGVLNWHGRVNCAPRQMRVIGACPPAGAVRVPVPDAWLGGIESRSTPSSEDDKTSPSSRGTVSSSASASGAPDLPSLSGLLARGMDQVKREEATRLASKKRSEAKSSETVTVAAVCADDISQATVPAVAHPAALASQVAAVSAVAHPAAISGQSSSLLHTRTLQRQLEGAHWQHLQQQQRPVAYALPTVAPGMAPHIVNGWGYAVAAQQQPTCA
eukprot:TRINITY_DN770_c3_g1_i1.p1 TRINITY_DN770_c3_g1~~TRINITY_DN770_c3_g1_i1.p1  ORF type:complete len:253 (+),score=21.62 TRINITY_DN770_c3_g1_i1:150-908(+)